MSAVDKLLKEDRWTVAQLDHQVGPGIIRFRSPVLGPVGVDEFRRLVTVAWAYAQEGGGQMPDSAVSSEMERFENHLCEAVQHDTHAILTAVLTFDGARQWVFYTRDVTEFGQRLSVIPDYHGQPYPIELTTKDDPTWAYLREQILKRILTHTPTPEESAVQTYIDRFRSMGLKGSPCPLGVLKQFEQSIPHRLPAAYRAYLLIAGAAPPQAWVGSDCTLRHLPQIREAADELLRENHLPALPEHAFVFLMHQGYVFFHFLMDGMNDDPPVFHYLEGQPALEKKFERFSDLIATLATASE